MTTIEILFLIVGGVIFVLSFLIPQKNGVQSGETAPTREEVRQLLAEEIKQVRGDMQDMVDETVGYSVEKAERAMERLTNEKISAVSEFSNTGKFLFVLTENTFLLIYSNLPISLRYDALDNQVHI